MLDAQPFPVPVDQKNLNNQVQTFLWNLNNMGIGPFGRLNDYIICISATIHLQIIYSSCTCYHVGRSASCFDFLILMCFIVLNHGMGYFYQQRGMLLQFMSCACILK